MLHLIALLPTHILAFFISIPLGACLFFFFLKSLFKKGEDSLDKFIYDKTILHYEKEKVAMEAAVVPPATIETICKVATFDDDIVGAKVFQCRAVLFANTITFYLIDQLEQLPDYRTVVVQEHLLGKIIINCVTAKNTRLSRYHRHLDTSSRTAPLKGKVVAIAAQPDQPFFLVTPKACTGRTFQLPLPTLSSTKPFHRSTSSSSFSSSSSSSSASSSGSPLTTPYSSVTAAYSPPDHSPSASTQTFVLSAFEVETKTTATKNVKGERHLGESGAVRAGGGISPQEEKRGEKTSPSSRKAVNDHGHDSVASPRLPKSFLISSAPPPPPSSWPQPTAAAVAAEEVHPKHGASKKHHLLPPSSEEEAWPTPFLPPSLSSRKPPKGGEVESKRRTSAGPPLVPKHMHSAGAETLTTDGENETSGSVSEAAKQTALLLHARKIIIKFPTLRVNERWLNLLHRTDQTKRWCELLFHLPSSDVLHIFLARLYVENTQTSYLNDLAKGKVNHKIEAVSKTFPKAAKGTAIYLDDLSFGTEFPVISNVSETTVSPKGEIMFGADIRYRGGLKMSFRFDLRFYGMKVGQISYSIEIKELSGRMRVMICPPPSQRFFIGFVAMPELNLQLMRTKRGQESGFLPVIIRWLPNLSVLATRIAKEALFEDMILPLMNVFPFPIIGEDASDGEDDEELGKEGEEKEEEDGDEEEDGVE